MRNAIDKKTEMGSHCVIKIILTTGESANDSMSEYEALRDVRHENIVALVNAYSL